MKAQAMGQLIIFIAAVLVVAVAAGVLLTTTDSLQQRALGTGRAVSAEIGTGMQLLEIFVEDGSTTLEN
ncbi:MAG: flagellin, partial [Candidatus Woesearchaeota archaeon]